MSNKCRLSILSRRLASVSITDRTAVLAASSGAVSWEGGAVSGIISGVAGGSPDLALVSDVDNGGALCSGRSSVMTPWSLFILSSASANIGDDVDDEEIEGRKSFSPPVSIRPVSSALPVAR